MRELLENNSRAQDMRQEVVVHQARQEIVRGKIVEASEAEATIDGLLTSLQVILHFPPSLFAVPTQLSVPLLLVVLRYEC